MESLRLELPYIYININGNKVLIGQIIYNNLLEIRVKNGRFSISVLDNNIVSCDRNSIESIMKDIKTKIIYDKLSILSNAIYISFHLFGINTFNKETAKLFTKRISQLLYDINTNIVRILSKSIYNSCNENYSKIKKFIYEYRKYINSHLEHHNIDYFDYNIEYILKDLKSYVVNIYIKIKLKRKTFRGIFTKGRSIENVKHYTNIYLNNLFNNYSLKIDII